MKLNRISKWPLESELIRQTANSRLGLYRTAGMRTVNFLISPRILSLKKGDRPGLIDPLNLYMSLNKA